MQTARRKKQETKTVALLGYTNTGKSTLLNLLTDSDTYVKNELFATLDPTSRKCVIDGVEFLLIDTVGFLQDLPHNLIEAFHSTLESALHCDLALVVCDAMGEYSAQLETTLQTLKELEFSAPYLVVMNKCENVRDYSEFPAQSIRISAKENIGIAALKQKILEHFRGEFYFCSLYVPYDSLNEYAKIKSYLTERNVEFLENGQILHVVIPSRYVSLFEKYIENRER